MLNPFAIEKELFAKTAAFSTLLNKLKGVIAVSVVEDQQAGRIFDAFILGQCAEMKETIEASKLYICKVCGKEFDEGRKLGGHVSRAHKGASQQSLPEDHSQDSEAYHPRTTKRRKNKVEFAEEEETGIKKEIDIKNEIAIKKVKVAEPIFEEA